jgi:hypothetical protein
MLGAHRIVRRRLPEPVNGSHEEERDDADRVVESVSEYRCPQRLVPVPENAEGDRVQGDCDDTHHTLFVWAIPNSSDETRTAITRPARSDPNNARMRVCK